jgi:hypothetical protein|tara:strand:- start:3892 stop:4272 length:381 start_codon:yes stop_codon:yes gene_type:complete
MVLKTTADALRFVAKKAKEAEKNIARKKKEGTYVAPKTKSRDVELAENELYMARGELKYAEKYGFTKANPKTKLKNRVKTAEDRLRKKLKKEGEDFDPTSYYSEGGSVTSKKSCGLAVRGHGAVIK